MSRHTSPAHTDESTASNNHIEAVTAGELLTNPALADGLTDMQTIDVYVRAQLALDLAVDTLPLFDTEANKTTLRNASLKPLVEQHPEFDHTHFDDTQTPANSLRLYNQIKHVTIPVSGSDRMDYTRKITKTALQLSGELGSIVRERAAHHLRNPQQYVTIPDLDE